jgi:S-DNA-T family DNA segregation ATPase FtsK/SpoIIIE
MGTTRPRKPGAASRGTAPEAPARRGTPGVSLRRVSFVAAASVLYLIASFFTDWTGELGRSLSLFLLEKFGGAILPPLFFLEVLFVSISLGKAPAGRLRQGVGVLLLAAETGLFLGLREISSGSSGCSILMPGELGRDVSGLLFRSGGPLGATLVGLCIAAASLWAFGTTLSADLAERLRGLRFPRLDPSGIVDFSKRSRNFLAEILRRPRRAPIEGDEGEEFDEADDEEGEGFEGREEDSGVSGSSEIPDQVLEEEDPVPEPVRSPRSGKRAVPRGNLVPRLAPEEFVPEDDFVLPDLPAPPEFPPSMDLFGPPQPAEADNGEAAIRPLGERIVRSLEEFGVEAELAETLIGPTVVQFRIQPAPGIKVSRVASLANDLALAIAASSLRVEAPIPGKPYIGIEIPNPKRRPVSLRSILESSVFRDSEAALPLPLGAAVDGEPCVVGLEELPHLLVAGTTGSGKSVFVNSCILGLCSVRTPEELRMILIDPKRVEMTLYERLPHILTPPVTEPKRAVSALAWALREMERRYSCFAQARIRNLEAYNGKVLPKDRLPHIVIVVDELADLMMTSPKEVEDIICRLAQMARATGIHLLLATQRPSVNVLTGLIKANIPARIAFSCRGRWIPGPFWTWGERRSFWERGTCSFCTVGPPSRSEFSRPGSTSGPSDRCWTAWWGFSASPSGWIWTPPTVPPTWLRRI